MLAPQLPPGFSLLAGYFPSSIPAGGFDSFIVRFNAAAPGEFVNPRGSEAKLGDVILEPGRRVEYATVSLLATVGMARVHVYRKPRVEEMILAVFRVISAQGPDHKYTRNVTISGKRMIRISTKSMASAKGAAPAKISHKDMRASLSEDLIT